MLDAVLAGIGDSPVALALKASRHAYPVVNAVHIMGLALLFGAIVTLDLRLLGVARSVAARTLAVFLSRMAAIGLVIAVLTGVLLFSVKPFEYAANGAFLTKVTLVAVGATHAIAVHASPGWRQLVTGSGEIGASLRLSAACSLAVWTAAIVAGRFIAFQ